MATYTADLFMTLDGFGTGPVGYWGKEGPELLEQRSRDFFAAKGQTLVFGADPTARWPGLCPRRGTIRIFAALNAASKVVISRTLQAPLALESTTLIAEDARDAVPRLKAESPLPLRGHGSISMNRALMAAGLVDRLEVMVFPVIHRGDRLGPDPGPPARHRPRARRIAAARRPHTATRRPPDGLGGPVIGRHRGARSKQQASLR